MGTALHGKATAAADWVRDQLGIDPCKVTGVTITIRHDAAVIADISYLLDEEQLAALELDDMAPADELDVRRWQDPPA